MRLLIGLGGNLGDPPRAFRSALDALSARHLLVRLSNTYRSAPVGPPQPRYWNQAAVVEVSSPLLGFLDECQALEEGAGRERDANLRWGPRPLDIDLLMARDVVHRGPRLALPHPHLQERSFALVPAAELAPEWVHPTTGRTLADLARDVDREGLERCG